MSEAKDLGETPQRERGQYEDHTIYCPFRGEVVPIEECRKCPPSRRELCPQMGGGG